VIESLTFELLDDIALGLQSASITAADLPSTRAEDLGPVVELYHSGLIGGITNWFDFGRHGELVRAMTFGGKWFSSNKSQGVVSISAITAQYSDWTDFAMRAKRAATDAVYGW
jgi:hypothetical protein